MSKQVINNLAKRGILTNIIFYRNGYGVTINQIPKLARRCLTGCFILESYKKSLWHCWIGCGYSKLNIFSQIMYVQTSDQNLVRRHLNQGCTVEVYEKSLWHRWILVVLCHRAGVRSLCLSRIWDCYLCRGAGVMARELHPFGSLIESGRLWCSGKAGLQLPYSHTYLYVYWGGRAGHNVLVYVYDPGLLQLLN